jgi:DNA-binding phage protein
MKMFDLEDVVSLLRVDVRRVGGQAAFAKKTGIPRAEVNRALTGARLPSRSVIDALGLAPVYVFKTDLPRRRTRLRR